MSSAFWLRQNCLGLCSSALLVLPYPVLAQPAVDQATLDPQSPMADLPDIGVAWPTLGAEDQTSQTESESESEEAAERRYTVKLLGVEALSATSVAERFDTLSALKAEQGKAANSAQIDRRIREDTDLLKTILRASGYYDALVEPEVETPASGPIVVSFNVTPGALFRFSEVKVSGLEETGEKSPVYAEIFGVADGDPVDADDVLTGAALLEAQLKDQGYPFAKISEPEAVVDHETGSGTLALDVQTGGLRKFGAIIVRGDRAPFDADHAAIIARFKSGEPFEQSNLNDLRRAVIATGLVSAASVEPEPGPTSDTADIVITMEPAKPRTIAGEIGYGTGEGARAEVSWTHRNFARPEGALTLRGVAGTREQLAAASFRRANFKKRDHTLSAQLSASHSNLRAFDARTLSISAGLERESTVIWQKRWTWRVGVETLATDERDIIAGGTVARRRTYFIGSLPLFAGYDRSDSLLDPTKGFRLSARVSPEVSFRNGNALYVRAQVDGSIYRAVGGRTVLAGRVRAGTITGAGSLDIAPSRRFYAGGGSSVRGYGFQNIGPIDAFDDPVGGRSLAEFALEARVRFGAFAVVPFVDGGNIYDSALPKFESFRFGAGVGLRYHTSFGPIRVDVGTPLNPRRTDSRIAVNVSLGQAF
jgi:translocation and assembly module TamA